MTHHDLKVAPEYMSALVSGDKTFEVRRNDRGFQRGDTLRLYEYGDKLCVPDCTDKYCSRKPRIIDRTITFVYSGDPRFGGHGGLAPGFVVLGLSSAVSS